MMLHEFSYKDHKIKHATEQIESELTYLEDFAGWPFVHGYVESLKKRIGKDENYLFYNSFRGYDNINPETYSENMSEMMFKKPWNKLNINYKKMKLKDYITSLNISNSRRVLRELEAGLSEKRFISTKDKVIYDQETMKITSITALLQDDKGTYYIKWKK